MIKLHAATIVTAGGQRGLAATVRLDDNGSVVEAVIGNPAVIPIIGMRVLVANIPSQPWVIISSCVSPQINRDTATSDVSLLSDPPTTMDILKNDPPSPGDAYFTLPAIRWFGLILRSAYSMVLYANERCRIILDGRLKTITAIARKLDFQSLGWRFVAGPSSVDDTGKAEGTRVVASLDSDGERRVVMEAGNLQDGQAMRLLVYGVTVQIKDGKVYVLTGDKAIEISDNIVIVNKDARISLSDNTLTVFPKLQVESQIAMKDSVNTVVLDMKSGILDINGPVTFRDRGAVLESTLLEIESIREALVSHTHSGPDVGPYVGTVPAPVNMSNTTKEG